MGGLDGHHPDFVTSAARTLRIHHLLFTPDRHVPGLRRDDARFLLSLPEDSPHVASGRLPLRPMRMRNEHGGPEGDGQHATRTLPHT